MPGNINLKDEWYTEVSEASVVEDKEINIDEVVEDIVDDLIRHYPQLINDIEKGIVSRNKLDIAIVNYLDKNQIILKGEKREGLIKKVNDYIFGYRIIQELLDDLEVSDIKIIDEYKVRKKVKGKRYTTDIKFANRKSLETFCNYVAIKNGGSISDKAAIQVLTDSTSHKDFILRIILCLKPVNTKSPSIAIRKIPKDKLSLEELRDLGMFNQEMYEYIVKAVKSKFNIIWCGKGASGKTSCMNAALEEIPEHESTLVIQESEELHSEHPDMIFQKQMFKTGESDVEYSLGYLNENGLRMDLDRIVIGEVKGAESMDLFNASYTGHIAWLSIHSPSASKAPNKLVHYMKTSGTDLKRSELLEMIAEIDLIIFMKNFKCAQIIEVNGFDYDKGQIITNPIFEFEVERELDGTMTGFFKRENPSCERAREKFRIAGYDQE